MHTRNPSTVLRDKAHGFLGVARRSRPVEVQLIDSGRNDTGTSLTGPGGLDPSNATQVGRFRNIWPAKDSARAVRRDALVEVIGCPHATLANGLTSGRCGPSRHRAMRSRSRWAPGRRVPAIR